MAKSPKPQKASSSNGASQASKKAPAPKKTGSSSSVPWFFSVLVALTAIGLSGFYYVAPHTFHAAVDTGRTHVLQFVDRYRELADAPASFNCDGATQHLTDVMPVKGFHVLCLEHRPENASLRVTAYKDGLHGDPLKTHSTAELSALKQALEQLLEIQPPEGELAKQYKQPYAFFSPDGERLETLSAMNNRIVFLFEGGQFIWPGIRVGHKRTIKNLYGKGDVEMETLSMTPLVFAVEEFLKDDEIDLILDLSMEHLKPSGVALNDKDHGRPATDWRTSSTYFLSSSSHAKVQDIDRRTADLVKVPVSHQEDVQVLRYEKTQKYDHHTDYFPPEHHQKSPHVLQAIEHGFKNRMITVFWYMSDVAKGGHTIFPRAGGMPPPTSMRDCTKGLKVPPRKRKVIVFYSMLPSGQPDPLSLHGGCPVEEGTKYSGNKWVWNKPYRL